MGMKKSDKWNGVQVFTTGQAAEVCSVSQQTIIRCFDSGRLEGFRVPGSRFRRIPRAELIRFMKLNEIPVDALNGVHRRVLLVSAEADLADRLGRAAGEDSPLEFCLASNPFEAGAITEQYVPHIIVADADMPHLDPAHVLQRVKSSPELADSRVVVLGTSIRPELAEALTKAGAAHVLKKPIDGATLCQRINSLMA